MISANTSSNPEPQAPLAQQPQIKAPPTHDQMAGAGLRALSDMVRLPEGDPQRAKAQTAYADVHKFASTEGIWSYSAPAVATMWQSWLRRSELTIRQDGERRKMAKMTPEQQAEQRAAWDEEGVAAGHVGFPGSYTPATYAARKAEKWALGGAIPYAMEYGDFTNWESEGTILETVTGRNRMVPRVTTEMTTKRAMLGGESEGTFLIDETAMGVAVNEHSEEAMDFRSLMGGGKVRPATLEEAKAAHGAGKYAGATSEGDDAEFFIEDEGGDYVQTSKGLVKIPNYDHRSEQFRQFFAGQMPGNMGLFGEQSAITTHLLNKTTELALDLFGYEGAKLQNIPSAMGEQQYAMPFTDDPYMNIKLMRDPAHMRAVQDLESRMFERGELGARWYETAAGLTMFGLEFAALRKGGGGAFGAGMRTKAGQRLLSNAAVVRKAPVLAWTGRAAGAAQAQVGASRAAKAIPLFNHTVRGAAEFAVFDATSNAITGKGTIWEGMVRGGATGLELAAFNTFGAVVPRKIAGWLMKRNKVLGGWLGNVGEMMVRSGESDVLQGGGRKLLEKWLKKMPSENPSLRRALEQTMGNTFAAEWTLKMWDQAIVGALFAGTSHLKAQTGQHWIPMLMNDPAKAGRIIMEGMQSEDAVGTILGFWMGSFGTTMSGDYAPHRAMRGQGPEQKQAVQRAMRDLAWSLAHPTNPKEVANAAKMFALLERLHPEVMEGGVSFAGLTKPPEGPSGPVAGPAGPGGRPVPDFEGQTSPTGRTRDRVEEMYRGWIRVAPKRKANRSGFNWLPDKTESPRFWADPNGELAVAKGKDGKFRIVDQQGVRAGKQTRRTKTWDTLEEAIAQANRIEQKSGRRDPYRSRRDEGEMEFPEAERPEGGERGGAQRYFFQDLAEMEMEIERAEPARAAELRQELAERRRNAGHSDRPFRRGVRVEGEHEGQRKLERELRAMEMEVEAAEKAGDSARAAELRADMETRRREAMSASEQTLPSKSKGRADRAVERQQRIFEENRSEPWAVGKTPGEVVQEFTRRATEKKARKKTAKAMGLTVRALETLEDGGHLGKLTTAEVQSMSETGRQARLKAIRKEAARAWARERTAHGVKVEDMTILDWVRSKGGISADVELGAEIREGLEHLNNEPGKFGHVVQPKGSGKGATWESLAEEIANERSGLGRGASEKLEEMTVSEFIDLVRSGDPMSLILEGFVPVDAAGMGGDWDVGRFQAEAKVDVDLGIRLQQSAEAGLQAREALEVTGLLDPWDSASSVKSSVMMRRLAEGDDVLLAEMRQSGQFPPETMDAAISRAVEGAIKWQKYAQIAVRKAAEAHHGEYGASRVDAYLQAMEDLASNGHLSETTRKALAKADLLDEFGGLHESAGKQMGDILDQAVWNAGEKPIEGAEDLSYLYAGINPWMVLAPRLKGSASSPWNPFRNPSVQGNEFIASRLTAGLARGLQMLGEGRGGTTIPARALRVINRTVTLGVGRFWSAAGLPSWLKAAHKKLIRDIGTPAAQAAARHKYEGQRFLGRLRVGGKRLPRAIRELALKLVDRGYFRDGRIDSPEKLAQHLGPQYGHLFFDIEREIAAGDAVGREMVETGLITTEQFGHMKGRYVMRSYIRTEAASLQSRVREGDYSTFYLPGRDMARAREAGTTQQIRNWDPDYVITSAHAQEAKMVEMMRWVQGIANNETSISFTRTELEAGETLNRSEVSMWMDRMAVDPETKEAGAKDPLTGRRYSKAALEMGLFAKNLRDRMQSEAEWRAGSPLGEKQHPYTEQKAELIDKLLGEDPLYIDRGTGAEMQNIQREAFYVPSGQSFLQSMGSGQDLLRYLGERMDEGTRFWRKAKTVNNPTHWGLNILSSIFTNYQTGGVTPFDMVKSIVTGEGRYADSMRRLLWWEKWMKEGRTEDRAELKGLDLLDAFENGWLRQADQLVGRMGAGTFHSTLIDSGVISNMLGGMLDRAEIQRGLEAAVAEGRPAKDLAFNEPGAVDHGMIEQLTDSIVEMSRRNAGGAGRVDRALVEGLTSTEKQERIAAISAWGSTYQMTELMFKYANSLQYLESNPAMTLNEAIDVGAKGTADYRDTSPLLRRWTTTFDMGAAQPGGARSGSEVLKAASQFAFAGPFMLYRSNIRPTQMHSMFAYPIRTAVTGAAWALAAGGITASGGAAWSELMEALPGTQGFQGGVLPAKDDWEEWAKLSGDPIIPMDGGSSPHMTPENNKAFGWLLQRIGAGMPWVGQAPSRGGRSRITDFSQFAEPVSAPFQVARTVDNWGEMTGREKGEALTRGLYGLQPLAVKAALATMGDTITGDVGTDWKQRAAKALRAVGSEFSTVLQPTPLSLLSPQTQRMFEMQYADGVPIAEWLEGHIDPFAKQQSKGQGLLELAYSTGLSSRKLGTWNSIRSADDPGMVRAMMAEVWPAFVDMGNVDQEKAMGVAKRLRDQVRLQVVSTYANQYRTHPGAQFEDLLKAQFDLHVDIRVDEEGQLMLAERPETTLGLFISHQPPGDQTQMLNFAVPFLNSRAFRGRAIGAMLSAVAERKIEPALLDRIYNAALTGPHDVGVLREMELEMFERQNYEHLPVWYDLFTHMDPPEGQAPRKAWNRVRRFFEGVADGDVALPASAPSLTDRPASLQDVGDPDLIELLPQRYSMERSGGLR